MVTMIRPLLLLRYVTEPHPGHLQCQHIDTDEGTVPARCCSGYQEKLSKVAPYCMRPLAQRHFDIRTGENGNRTADLDVGGRPLYLLICTVAVDAHEH